jgi:hypothetical protein
MIETDCVVCNVKTVAEEITQHALCTIEKQRVFCKFWLKEE